MTVQIKDYAKSFSQIYDIITSHKNYIEDINSLPYFLNPHIKEKNCKSKI
jgi:hypothetical protein